MRRKAVKQWFRDFQDGKRVKCSNTWSMNKLHDAVIDDFQKLSEIIVFNKNEEEASNICVDITDAIMAIAYKMDKKSGRQRSLPLDRS